MTQLLTRTIQIGKVFGGLSLFVLLIGCASNSGEVRLSWQVAFFSLGAKVEFEMADPVRRLQAFDADGVMIAQLNFPGPPRQTESLYFEWQAGETYRFEATLTTGELLVQETTAPRTYRHGNLEIAIPYGTARQPIRTDPSNGNQRALVLRGHEMTATVLVTNGNVPADFALELCLPAGLTVVRSPADWQRQTTDAETCLSTTGRLGIAAEVWFREFVLETSGADQLASTAILGRVRFTTDTGQTWEQRATVQLQLSTVPEIAEHLSIESVEMPTDATGTADPKQRADTIYYPRPLFSWFRVPQTDAFEPITYQTIRLHNRGAETIHVVVSAINVEPRQGENIPFLAPPETAKGWTDQSAAFASLPGGTITAVPLPLYFHPVYLKHGKPEQAIPGEYEREISVKVWGSDATILREKRPLHLIVPNQQALLVSLLAILSSSIGFAAVIRYRTRLFAAFTTKQLIVIALFSTTVFVTVMVPSTLLLNLVRAVLGPLSVLLTGLINETLYYALLTALLIYINGSPKSQTIVNPERTEGVGVILLVSVVRLLLSGVTFGLFTPMAVIYTGTSVLLLETGFWFVRRRGLLAWALVLGICDALAVYVDFQLSILFYRLFYADWYILLRILIEGFLYTFIGVLFGARLGRGLWRVAD